MLHDLLLSLLGKPGSYVRQSGMGTLFEVDDSLKLFTPPELGILNRIVELGYHYQQIDQYLQSSVNPEYGDMIAGSTYQKAFALGLDKGLGHYRQLILDIESDYLNESVFMVAQLQEKLSDYFIILPDLHRSVKYSVNERLRGGQILDYVYEKTQSGNPSIRSTYQNILDACYVVLYQQIQGWLLYGIINDHHEEFFIQKVEERTNGHHPKKQRIDIEEAQADYSWENTFSLKTAMLPLHFISLQQAEKILFIGKSIKVLKSHQQIYLPEPKTIELVQSLQQYDTFRFSKCIETIRDLIGKQLLEVIVNKSDLQVHLQNIKQYVLMGNGEFYQAFFEEAQKILQFPQTTNAIHELNFNILQQIIAKLKLDDDENSKRLSFNIFHNGFEFKNFNSLQNLLIQGNIIQTESKNLRFGPVKRFADSGGIFHDLKQSVENGFSISVTFRFKPYIQTKSPYNVFSQTVEEIHSSSLVLVLHNTELSRLNQGISGINDAAIFIKVTLNQKRNSTIRVDVKQKSTEHNPHPNLETICKWRFDPQQLDFAEGDLYTLKIVYRGDDLALCLDDGIKINEEQEQPQLKGPYIKPDQLISPSCWLKIPLKIQKYLNLEMGRCGVGLANEGENGQNMIDVCSWKMTGFNVFNNDDSWNGLNLKYNINHPLTLFITPSFQEKLIMLFRYFFPIRHTQYQLNEVWLLLTRRAKEGMIISENIPQGSKQQKHYIMNSKEFRFVMMVHNLMLHVVNSLWNYFQYDILQLQWQRLMDKIQAITDFELLRKLLDDFQTNVSNHIFLNFPQIIKQIFLIIRQCQRFIELIHRLYYQQSIETIYKDTLKIKIEFEEAFMQLYSLITMINKSTNKIFLFQLLLRLDYNGYFNERVTDHYK